MTSSAAVSSDLQEKKGPDDVNDALKDHNHGSSSGTKTLNLGVQTVTSRGDTDQTAVGQLSVVKKEKRSRNETDKKYNEKKKSKLQHYPEVCNELKNKIRECEFLRKLVELKDENARKDAKRIETLESQVSLLLGERTSEIQHSQSLSRLIEVVYKEKDELKKENEQLKQNDFAHDLDELFNLPEPSQPIQTDGGHGGDWGELKRGQKM